MKQQFDGVLAVCFGTKQADLFERCFIPIYKVICEQSDAKVHMLAVTSDHVRSALQEQGKIYPSPEVALEKLAAQCRHVLVVPVFMAVGNEQKKLSVICRAYEALFEELVVMPPLLPKSVVECANVLDSIFPLTKNEGVLLVGHGSTAATSLCYGELQEVLAQKKREDIFIPLLHGRPDVTEAVAYFKEKKISRINIAFLMICAGHHARETLLQPDGAKNLLEKSGFEVKERLGGLGENAAFVQLFVKKVK